MAEEERGQWRSTDRPLAARAQDQRSAIAVFDHARARVLEFFLHAPLPERVPDVNSFATMEENWPAGTTPAQSEPVRARDPLHRRKILVVDDEDEARAGL